MKFTRSLITGHFEEISIVRNLKPHTGIDLGFSENTTLRAISDGVIDKVFDGSGAIGKGLSIRMEDGTRAIYGHMNDVQVKVGDHINAGEIIGISGNTGNSTGAHLHFGLRSEDGTFLNPTPLAEKLTEISGNTPHLGILGKLAEKGTDKLREKAADATTEIALGIFDALKEFLEDFTLVGSAILIILKVAGYRDGGRWATILLLSNILIKYLFGVI